MTDMSKLLWRVADFLPLPEAVDLCLVLDTPKSINRVIRKHHTSSTENQDLVMAQVAAEMAAGGQGKVTVDMLQHVWLVQGLRFPWSKVLAMAVIVLNHEVAKFICASFSRMCPDPDPVPDLFTHLIVNISDRRQMLDQCDSAYCTFTDLSLPVPEWADDEPAYQRMWRRLAKVLVEGKCVHPVMVVSTMCETKKQPRLVEWLDWLVQKFTLPMLDLESTTEMMDVCSSLVGSGEDREEDRQKLKVLISSSWTRGIDMQPALSQAICNDNVEACALLHQVTGVFPLTLQDKQNMQGDVATYFKYAMDPKKTNFREDYIGLKRKAEDRHQEVMKFYDDEERKEHAEMLSRHSREVRDMQNTWGQRRATQRQKLAREAENGRRWFVHMDELLPYFGQASTC